jgi:hypothetical protein
MKKILFVLALVMSAVTMMAEDVIIKTSEEKITGKIIEISSSQVKYNDINMPDGPVFVLNTDEIATIIFSNGQVKVYNHSTAQSIVKQEETQLLTLYRTGNRYTYNGQTMKGDHYANFLKNNCADAYRLYDHGRKVSTAGWVLLGVGVGLDIGFSWWLPYSGYVGLACELACIPTLIVGYTQMHRSADLFNSFCVGKKQAYWSVTASENGIGLALNF